MRWPIYQASQILHRSGIIAYPTEAVWGLGCDPFDESALKRLLYLKQRPHHKGLILIAASLDQFDFLIHDLPQAQKDRMQKSWPGPFTFLVPHHNRVHSLIHGQFKTVAIRVSAHPIVKQLCEQFGGPIVSTSANLSGQPTVKNAIQASKFLGPELDFILSGPLGASKIPSQIIDLDSGHIVRG